MNSSRELQVKRGVVFRLAILTVRLLAHLHIGNRVASLLEVGDFSGCVFRCAVKHGDGNHGGQVVGDAAGEEQVEARLVSRVDVEVGLRVPRVNGRTVGDRLVLVRGMLDQVYKAAVAVEAASVEFMDGVTSRVAWIVEAVRIGSIGRLRHPDAEEPCRDGRR